MGKRYYTDATIAELKSRMPEVLAHYGVAIGPKHEVEAFWRESNSPDDTPDCFYSENNNELLDVMDGNCDVFGLIERIEGIDSFPEQVRAVAEILGYDLDGDRDSSRESRPRTRRKRSPDPAGAVGAAGANPSGEVPPAPSWLSNPHIGWGGKDDTLIDPSVPALVWWLKHPDMGMSHVRTNTFTGRIETEMLPWNPKPHAWTDADTANMRCLIQSKFDPRDAVKVGKKENLADALVTMAHERRYDPLQDMLDALGRWDGRPRAHTLLHDFLGADENDYTRAISHLMLSGAVMRAMRPGCKYDYIVVLEGAQGLKKSSFLRALAMRDEFFTDTLGNLGKEAGENLQGRWIVEVGELADFRKREIESVKQFLTKLSDDYRAAYGRFSEQRPRRCIFVATTNSKQFLTDPTGNRRFLPVPCKAVAGNLDPLADDAHGYMEQVWAEMMHEYRENGNRLELVLPPGIESEADAVRDGYSAVDTKTGLIEGWLSEKCRDGERVCILQIMEDVFDIGKSDANQPKNKAMQNEISEILDHKLSDRLERLPGRPKHSKYYDQQTCWVYHAG